MEKYFNTAGPNKADIQYTLNPLKRINLPEIEDLIEQRKYFVVHAPRQTGKTSMLLALRDYLNASGKYFCVYANIEPGQANRNDVETVNDVVCTIIALQIDSLLGGRKYSELYAKKFRKSGKGAHIVTFLTFLSEEFDKPFILFLDEIDALVGDSLVSVLRQLRSGYEKRPDHFPQSVILCGVRDVRDYRITLSNQEIITGGSAFNVKAKSLRMGNFSKEEIHELYMQHTEATGQVFDEACFPMIWKATEGQPWLVNALAYEVTYEMKENRDRSVRIIPEMIYKAQESIIYQRYTHIDALIDKLKEPRVRRIIEPLLANDEDADESLFPPNDLQYCVDLGLIAQKKTSELQTIFTVR